MPLHMSTKAHSKSNLAHQQGKRIDFPAVIVITKYYQFFKHVTSYKDKQLQCQIAILKVLLQLQKTKK